MPHSQELLVANKRIVWFLVLLPIMGLAPGCASRDAKSQAPAVSPMPYGSFAQNWYNALRLGNDDIHGLHLRDDTLYVYSGTHKVYAVSRTGGDLKYMARPNVSGGTLRPPLHMGE